MDDSKGEIRFSPVAEFGAGGSSSGSSSGSSGAASSAEQQRSDEEDEEAAAAAAARYGCDPRNSWSPWRCVWCVYLVGEPRVSCAPHPWTVFAWSATLAELAETPILDWHLM